MFRKTSANYGEDGEEMVGPEEATPWHVFKEQSMGANTFRNTEEISGWPKSGINARTVLIHSVYHFRRRRVSVYSKRR